MKFEFNHAHYDVDIFESTYSDGSLKIDLINLKDGKKFEMTYKIDKPHPPRTAYVALNKFGSFIENNHLGKITNEIEHLRDACGWYTLVEFGDLK